MQINEILWILEILFFINYFSRFPKDPNALGIDRQFLWGDSLLISPVVEQVCRRG